MLKEKLLDIALAVVMGLGGCALLLLWCGALLP